MIIGGKIISLGVIIIIGPPTIGSKLLGAYHRVEALVSLVWKRKRYGVRKLNSFFSSPVIFGSEVKNPWSEYIFAVFSLKLPVLRNAYEFFLSSCFLILSSHCFLILIPKISTIFNTPFFIPKTR